ncbi:MAG TPA: hypothetical protein VFJ19_17420 [Nocardioidaceae bacterium]|nr:hypothetical protein [Nocardioidaceae bacterium]
MPTTRPRHQVTETPSVQHALDAASRHWPGLSRGQLLVKLVEAGGEAMEAETHERERRRRKVVAETSGKYTGSYGEGYLDGLRGDWPE